MHLGIRPVPGVGASGGADRRRSSVVRRVLVAAAAGCLFVVPAAVAQVVERVVDGDTIIVRGVGRVRLIGVDTPETVDPRRPVEFFGKEASAFTRSMVGGKRVRLEYDWERTDRYGRTLAYVYLADGTFLNAEIIRQGYGHAYTRFPFKHLDWFRRLQREAREADRGLWGSAPASASDGGPSTDAAAADASDGATALARWDDNGNGRITCAEARRHGIAPVSRGHPAYRYMRDGDGDGIVCE